MKVLFLSVPTGHGHHQAASAVLEFFKDQENVECRFLDVFDNASPVLADSLSKGYLFSTKHAPNMYGHIYGLAEKRNAEKHSNLGKLIKSALNYKLLPYLKEYNPDIIVATHVFSAIAITYLKKKYKLKAKTIAIVTDFTIHPFWEDADFDYYITPSELLEFQASKKGIPKEKIKAFGIPIHPKFSQNREKEEVRKALGLPNRYTILLMMGSMGYGSNVIDTVKALDKMNEEFQLITVCGNNKKLKARIDRMGKHKNILNFGFTSEVHTLMDASDCIITKPGGLSTSEALAKGLPIMMLDPIPGQEDRNQEFMLNNGIALSIGPTFPATEAVYQLMHFPFKAESMKQNMKHFQKPDSAERLGKFMLELCGEDTK